MPAHIRPLVLPSPLHLPMYSADDDKRPKNSTKEKKAVFVVPADIDSMDISDDENEHPLLIPGRYINDRYIPNFDKTSSRCWWDWVPHQLDDNGQEKFDFNLENENAWAAFEEENSHREALQKQWWNENPQHF